MQPTRILSSSFSSMITVIPDGSGVEGTLSEQHNVNETIYPVANTMDRLQGMRKWIKGIQFVVQNHWGTNFNFLMRSLVITSTTSGRPLAANQPIVYIGGKSKHTKALKMRCHAYYTTYKYKENVRWIPN